MFGGRLVHFVEAIDAGADMIMADWTIYEALDKERPAGLSPVIIDDILRNRLGYGGVVMTSPLDMAAVTKHYETGKAAVSAIMAGCDILLQISPDIEKLRARIEAVAGAVEEGRISLSRVDASLARIERLKRRYALSENAFRTRTHVPRRPADMRALTAANKKAALDGIVLVRDREGLLPLPQSGSQIIVICPPTMVQRAGRPKEYIPVGPTLGHYMKAIAPQTREIHLNTVPADHEIDRAIEAAKHGDIIVVCALFANQSPKQVKVLKRLLGMGKPVVVVGLGDPGDLLLFPEAGTFLAVNSPVPICTESAAGVLFGKARCAGTLPVPIGDIYPVDHGMIGRGAGGDGRHTADNEENQIGPQRRAG